MLELDKLETNPPSVPIFNIPSFRNGVIKIVGADSFSMDWIKKILVLTFYLIESWDFFLILILNLLKESFFSFYSESQYEDKTLFECTESFFFD